MLLSEKSFDYDNKRFYRIARVPNSRCSSINYTQIACNAISKQTYEALKGTDLEIDSYDYDENDVDITNDFCKSYQVGKYLYNEMKSRTKLVSYTDENGYRWRCNASTGELVDNREYIRKLLRVSLLRTQQVVNDILKANEWKYFFTLTLAGESRCDDHSSMLAFREFRKWLHVKYPKSYYIAFPERQQDGVLHFHLLLGGFSFDMTNKDEVEFKFYDKKNKVGVFQLKAFKLGRTNFSKIRNNAKVNSYVTKYIKKDIQFREFSKKRYFTSRKINRIVYKRKYYCINDRTLRNLDRFIPFLHHAGYKIEYYNSFSCLLIISYDLIDDLEALSNGVQEVFSLP